MSDASPLPPDPSLPAPATVAVELARRVLHLSGTLLAAWAPGRVNLVGEHTDYNEGFVLPIGIDRVVAVAGRLSQPSPAPATVRLYSDLHQEETSFRLDRLPSAHEPENLPLWARYVAGALGELRESGAPLQEFHGFSAAISGDIPAGHGLSSSAALVMATLLWLDAALHLDIDPLKLASIGQRAETRGTGVRVGILDHAASVLSQPDHAVLIDCRSLTYEMIPFALPEVSLLICDSGVERSLAASAYNQRRQECEAAVADLNAAVSSDGERRIGTLRDVTSHDLLRLGGRISQPARQRAWHVVTENERVQEAVAALRRHDAPSFGERVLASHASLRDNYAVSSPELDTLVELATQSPGAYGARLVGAGFGGGVLIVTAESAQEEVIMRLQTLYPARTGRQPDIRRVRPAGGSGSAVVAEA